VSSSAISDQDISHTVLGSYLIKQPFHGLQEWHKRKLCVVPNPVKLKPRADFLQERYELFKKAG
jgi:hypothetical protein